MQEALEMSASKSSILGPWLVRRAASSKSILFDNELDNMTTKATIFGGLYSHLNY